MVSHLDQALTHIDRKEFVKAVHELMQHLNTDFHDENAIFFLGSCHLELGNYALAAALNRQAI